MSPAASANIGVAQLYTKNRPSLHEGRGYEAPKAKASNHPCGSQGKH